MERSCSTVVEKINHPEHYGGDTTYETIKIIRHLGWLEGFCLGNALKYIMCNGKKEGASKIEDLKKAEWYLKYLRETLEKEKKGDN